MIWLRRYVFHNFGLKALSLAAAVVLWALIAAEPELETSIGVPVEFRNVPAALEIVTDQDSDVYLQVRGPAGELRGIERANVAVVLDLADVQKPGTRTFALDRSQVILPHGVRLVKSVPSQVRLVFERRSTRAVSVMPRFLSDAPPGYEVASYTVEPPMLKVVGPESHVAVIGHAVTDPIDLAGLTSAGHFITNAYLPDPHLRFVDVQSVRVNVEMRKR